MVVIRPREHSHFSLEPKYARPSREEDFSSIAGKTYIRRVELLAKMALPDFLRQFNDMSPSLALAQNCQDPIDRDT